MQPRTLPARSAARLLAVVSIATLTLASVAHADILRMPDGELQVQTRSGLPANGTTQSQVLARHGEPRTRHPTVAGDRPLHPPITRWEYGDFEVVFEHQRVIQTVLREAR